MYHNLPPNTHFIVTDAMVKERSGQIKKPLRVARRLPEFSGLPFRRRVCANCGKMFLGWGTRLLDAARVSQQDIEEPKIALKTK